VSGDGQIAGARGEGPTAGAPRYGSLPEALYHRLQAIAPSQVMGMITHPCQVTLRDGGRVDRVHVVAAADYLRAWRVPPEADPDKRCVRVEDVADLAESPSRLPRRLVEQIYAAEESGMGYHVFTLEFTDGARLAVRTGNTVEFVPMPPGRSTREIRRVYPHLGRERAVSASALAHYWCLYDGVRAPA
jgi:hypothetical protein